jgi:predicted RNA binding protein YcfA (HicA-like mRNA interferase family)
MPKSLSLSDLLKRLKKFGVITLRRGKGSHRILLLPDKDGSRKGPTFTVTDHGSQTPIYGPMIKAMLRMFNIDPHEFWK